MEKHELNNSTIIRNISTNQKEILMNIMKLYNDGLPFDCDITASALKFYERPIDDEKFYVPEPRILFDVYPQMKKIHKIYPLKQLPLKDNSIHSVVVDLPFVISPPNCKSAVEGPDTSLKIYRRFSGFYPVGQLFSNYYHWLAECYRVLDDDGICIFKCQNTVSGGIEYSTEEYSFMAAQDCGFYCIDKFILRAKSVMISAAKYKEQQHARKYTSTFFVFQKTTKPKDTKVDYKAIIERERANYIERAQTDTTEKFDADKFSNYKWLF